MNAPLNETAYRCFEFGLEHPDLTTTRFLMWRSGLSANGDIESGFLEGLVSLRRHSPGAAVPMTIKKALEDREVKRLVVVRNPALVLDTALPNRVTAALAQLPDDGKWTIAGAGGLGPEDQRHIALYASATPAIPEHAGPQPIVDVMPDLYILNADFARTVIAASSTPPDVAMETILILEGYLQNRVSVFLPSLSAGINGDLLARDFSKLSQELSDRFSDRLPEQTLSTLAGPIEMPPRKEEPVSFGPTPAPAPVTLSPISEGISATIADHCTPLTLSIVVRTRFARRHLLDRLLTSLTRARRPEIEMEVILSTDHELALAEDELARLQKNFCNLSLRLQVNVPQVHSRVTNLIGGLRAARFDYVVVVDDDDYVDLFALEALTPVSFMGNQPLIVTSTEVHEEAWEKTPSGRWVLTNSIGRDGYAACGWADMFSGVNRLPICSIIFPRTRLNERLDKFFFAHDLSEDYALLLLMLTDPQLPYITEVRDTFCHISLRGRENSVSMPDRRPWVRDIASYLGDLTSSPAVAGPGLWQLLRTRGHQARDISTTSNIADLRVALSRAESELALLRRENQHLRQQHAPTGESSV